MEILLSDLTTAKSLQHCSGLRGALLREASLRGPAEVVGSTPIVASGNFFARAAEAAAELRRRQYWAEEEVEFYWFRWNHYDIKPLVLEWWWRGSIPAGMGGWTLEWTLVPFQLFHLDY